MRHPSLIPLSHDHHHGLGLALRCRKQALGQLKPTGPAGLRQRADEVLGFYQHSLIPHLRAEEAILFPRMQSLAPHCAALIVELARDHQSIRQLVEQIKTGTGLAKSIFDLGDLLERHIRKEERELFPIFEQEVGKEQADAIGDEMRLFFGNAQQAR